MTFDVLPRELLVFEGARQIADGDCVIAGTGLPLLAALVAQRTHAPNTRLVIESGVVFPRVIPTPMSVVDPRIMNAPSRLGSLLEILGGFVQRGLVTTGFLGGAQIDQHANINSSWVQRDRESSEPGGRGDDRERGERSEPGGRGDEWIRLPGSGGANDIASHCRNIVILTSHERRRFPEHCDYITSPGFLDGPGARRKVGLGPLAVKIVTDLCVMEGNDDDGHLTVTKRMPDVALETILANTGFEPRIADEVSVVELPTDQDLHLLRTELDPQARYFPERTAHERKAPVA